jgi:PsbP
MLNLKILKNLSLIIFIAFSQFLIAQPYKAVINTTFSKETYTIQYPNDWKVDTSKDVGADIFIFASLENEKDKFRENINVIIQDLTGQDIDLEKYKDITDKQIDELATEGSVIESSVVEKDKDAYYKIIYGMSQGKYKLIITSICYIYNEKAYLATFTTEKSSYENYKKIGDDIFESFKVIK